jgi:hypothetical protein
MGRDTENGDAGEHGFRIGDSVDLMAKRQRHEELSRKIKNGAVSEAERNEFLRLDDALHGNSR